MMLRSLFIKDRTKTQDATAIPRTEAATQSGQADRPADTRGSVTTNRDQSAHRRHQWLYEDLLA